MTLPAQGKHKYHIDFGEAAVSRRKNREIAAVRVFLPRDLGDNCTCGLGKSWCRLRRRLRNAVSQDHGKRCAARAIRILFAFYSLRPSEAAKIRLDDVDREHDRGAFGAGLSPAARCLFCSRCHVIYRSLHIFIGCRRTASGWHRASLALESFERVFI